MANYLATDLWFTSEGDLAIDGNGDIRDTSSTQGRGLIQEIRTRLRAEPGDWKLAKSLGANLRSYVGTTATTPNISRLIRHIFTTLTSDRLILSSDLEIIPIQLPNDFLILRIVVHSGSQELIDHIGYDATSARFIGLR